MVVWVWVGACGCARARARAHPRGAQALERMPVPDAGAVKASDMGKRVARLGGKYGKSPHPDPGAGKRVRGRGVPRVRRCC